MPLYDVKCPIDGIQETFSRTVDAPSLRCPVCARPAPQYFSAANAPQCSVSAVGEDSKDPGRIADGTSSFNLGLPGVETVVGTHADGKAKTSYRPISNNELSTSRKVRDYAARNGLVPVGEAKRAIGGRSR